MPTVLLVRHGRTTANAGGTLAGWTPGVALDEAGAAQAQALADRLARTELRPCRLLTSPLERCRQTAEALLAAQPDAATLTPLVDERLGECQYGAWTGRPIAQLAKEPLWRTVQDQPSAAVFPQHPHWPAESLAAMQQRAVRAVREVDAAVRAEHGEQGVWIAVTHGDVIKAILADALGVHLDMFQRIHVDPASVSVVRYTERRPFVLRTNDVGGDLNGLLPPAAPAGAAASGDAASGDGITGDGIAGTDPTGADPTGADPTGDAVVGGGPGAPTQPPAPAGSSPSTGSALG